MKKKQHIFWGHTKESDRCEKRSAFIQHFFFSEMWIKVKIIAGILGAQKPYKNDFYGFE